jgi:hypothetical protein
MPRELPKDNSDGRDYIQFRGLQTSVTVDRYGVRFETEHRGGQVAHKPLPVVNPDSDDPPDDAVARPVADALVESNPLIGWGVACEQITDDGDICGDVFDTPKAEASHRSVHTEYTDGDADADDDPGRDDDDAGDGDDDEDGGSDDT